MRHMFVIPLLSIFFLLNCSKEDTKPMLDSKLFGDWIIDSICENNNTCINSSYDTWNKKKNNIILSFNERNEVTGRFYHDGFFGSYSIIKIESDIKLKVSKNLNTGYTPDESKWEPYCVEFLNNVVSYKLENNNKIRLYKSDFKQTMYITRK